MKLKQLLLFILFSSPAFLFGYSGEKRGAQEALIQNEQLGFQTSDSTQKTTEPSKFGMGVSFGAGTLGLGGSLNFAFNPHLQMRVGYGIINFDAKTGIEFDGQPVNLAVNGKSGGASLLFDLFPSKKSSFHFILGVVKSENKYVGTATPKDSQSYGQILYTPEQVGKMEFTLQGNEWMPVMGIGFGRGVCKNRVGVGFDIGAAYSGALKSTIVATNSFEPSATKENEAVIDNAFSDFKFFPFLGLRINVKLF